MEKMENVTYMQAGPVLIIGLPEEVDDHVCNGIREETDRYISAEKVQKLIFDFLRLALWTAQVLNFAWTLQAHASYGRRSACDR